MTDESGRRAQPDVEVEGNVLVRVIVTDRDRIQLFELFDICDTDRALARFEGCATVSRETRGCRETTGTSGRPQAELETEHL